ncbi:hypothetical protein JW948_13045 [bacterium]|nr:hypothetical protein [bacterium]
MNDHISRRMTTFILITASVILGFYGFSLLRERAGRNTNPYAYDLEPFRRSDSANVLYSETGFIDFSGQVLTALCADPGHGLIVAAGSKMFRVDTINRISEWIPADEPVRCLAVDPERRVYLGYEKSVGVYSPDGSRLDTWQQFSENAILAGIAAGRDVYVADAGNRVIYRMNREGRMLASIGEKDPVKKIPGFVIPGSCFDIQISADGSLWAVNPGRHKLEHYSPDGDLIASWGHPSMRLEGFSGCCNPTYFALTPEGNIVTSEKGLERIKVYSPDGELRDAVALPGQFDEGTVGLDLAAGPEGRIFVMDPSRARIRIFEKGERE